MNKVFLSGIVLKEYAREYENATRQDILVLTPDNMFVKCFIYYNLKEKKPFVVGQKVNIQGSLTNGFSVLQVRIEKYNKKSNSIMF